MRNDFFIFDGINSSDFGLGIYGNKLFNAPKRKVESVKVPGRNGNIIMDSGSYENIEVSYKSYIIKDVPVNLDGFRNMQIMHSCKYYRLEDTVKPEEFRLARALPFDPEIIGILKAGKFDVKFDCKPQRYLKLGEIPLQIVNGQKLFNKYGQTALPMIRVEGNGSLTIGTTTIEIENNEDYIFIDCELQEAYRNGLSENRNNNIILTNDVFPELVAGENVITFSGLTEVKLWPRWWIV